jgi:predicted glycoside hydrolase/deacetylase ChbG (UPF0249 family)
MTERGALDYTAKIIKENPNLKTGLHIDLDQIFLMDVPKGFFKRLVKVMSYMKEQIKVAINKQFDKFLKAGFTSSHFDSHHHAQMHPGVFSILKELNLKYSQVFSNQFILTEDYEIG